MSSIKQQFRVMSEYGLHARPATVLAKIAIDQDCATRMITKHGEADCGSVLSILMLGVEEGETIEIVCSGQDAESTMERLRQIPELELIA